MEEYVLISEIFPSLPLQNATEELSGGKTASLAEVHWRTVPKWTVGVQEGTGSTNRVLREAAEGSCCRDIATSAKIKEKDL